MRRDLSGFVVRGALLAAPLVVALGIYIAYDPCRVLRSYDFGNYYDEAAPVELNRDYVSFQLLRKYQPKMQYDSFIFGSSRSFPIHCDEWQKHVPGARAFHWPAASENIFGIAKKVEYLERSGVALKNALVEVTTGLWGVEPRWDAMHRLPRELSGESWSEFQTTFLKAYFSDAYFIKYMVYAATGARPAFTKGALGIERGAVRIEPETNDYIFASNERDLRANSEAYYARRRSDFPPHRGSPPCAMPVVGAPQLALLEEIRAAFDRQQTKYRIVRMPMYDQVCLDAADRRALDAIFGAENVFDFTGVNEFTADEENFYDPGHVRVAVANLVLDAMYGPAAER